jgi:ribulose-phosphate 3-epimerase
MAFAPRVHIDLMDGTFTPNTSPALKRIWWPDGLVADVHLMYQEPMLQLEELLKLRPNLVIIHFEADVDHIKFANRLRQSGIKAGLALLQQTTVKETYDLLPMFDHVMVYSGSLGKFGGHAELSLLDKVRAIRGRFAGVEIGWDGGVNDQNARQLVEAGVGVLNVGGFIQKADDPAAKYRLLSKLVQ